MEHQILKHKIVKVFTAISGIHPHEIEAKFKKCVLDENNYYFNKGVYIEIVDWDRGKSPVPKDTIKTDLAKKINGCDLVLLLCSTKSVLRDNSEIIEVASLLNKKTKTNTNAYLTPTGYEGARAKRPTHIEIRSAEDRLSSMGISASTFEEINEFLLRFFARVREYIDSQNLFTKPENEAIDDKYKRIGVNSFLVKGSEDNAAEEPNRILFLAANTSTLGMESSENEFREIRDELKRGKVRNSFNLMIPEIGTHLGDWLRAMSAMPTVVHFSGRGAVPKIQVKFEDQSERLMTLGFQALNMLIRSHRSSIEVVVLNTCFDPSEAKELSKLGIFVIGHSGPVSNDSAISFAKGFYIGLGEGRPVIDSIDAGVLFIMATNVTYENTIQVWKDGEKLDL